MSEKLSSGQIRMERAIASCPIILQMVQDLASGAITPATSLLELQLRYRGRKAIEINAVSMMTHACRAFAEKVGSVLVLTDSQGTKVFGQVDDPGLELDDPRSQPALRELVRHVPADHVQSWADRRGAASQRKTIECPIYAMPKFCYLAKHGPEVSLFGTYLSSYDAPIRALETA